ncbi:hypothetical protein [Stratiformator vulcanicus]|uniref:Toprim domain-containing protein n=1 Tax=Stratiformator vulcanicus TaxID=2527980 RepID=A0A517R3C3_9PLAN|nr:hypothetical protein [Stratiformator vulcanicus]QDT38382.1 hypothetical protein Pan189_27750 [Stratiformator vulcanicus]
MPPRKSAYIRDVDRLVEETSVASVLSHYGLQPPEKSSGEHRIPCVFSESCQKSQYGQLTIKLDDVAHRIYCHSCGVRGNLLTLIHGLEKHEPPAGGKLRGDEFKAAVSTLREIRGLLNGESDEKPSTSAKLGKQTSSVEPAFNVPLVRHDKGAARELADLCDELVTDVAEMSPEAAAYVRQRPWMTPELMRKWGVGWIPGNGRSLFRRNYFVYTHRNERGEVVSYSGRDLFFEEKWQQWLRRGKPDDARKPFKHRYVSGYRRGLELYGGHATRLGDSYVKESLANRGLVVVEGMNEVLRMHDLEVAAIGLGSNRATEEQIAKIVRYARSLADNRVLLLPDCDEEGEDSFRDLLWKLAENQVEVRLGCSRTMYGGKFDGRQPENFSSDEWTAIEQRQAIRFTANRTP